MSWGMRGVSLIIDTLGMFHVEHTCSYCHAALQHQAFHVEHTYSRVLPLMNLRYHCLLPAPSWKY